MNGELDYVQVVLDLMRSTLGEKIARYYYGDPEQIPTFDLPALIVESPEDDLARDGMGDDQDTESVVIKVVLNKVDDWAAEATDKDMTLYKLRRIVGLKDLATKGYQEGTIKHAIRNSSTQGISAIARDVTVRYETVLRSGGEEPLVTAEAVITVPIMYDVQVDEFDSIEQM
ncbi:hypothetical protein [Rhodococcus sp. NPDC004095]